MTTPPTRTGGDTPIEPEHFTPVADLPEPVRRLITAARAWRARITDGHEHWRSGPSGDLVRAVDALEEES